MICPTCGTHIPDGSLRCPACHASTGVTIAMPVLQGRWCPRCGAGAGWHDEVCHCCGMVLEREWGPGPQDGAIAIGPDGPLAGDEPAGAGGEPADQRDTRVLPRIESAIPPEGDPEGRLAAQETIPHAGRFLLAAFASAALVGGLAMLITHPWNPDAYSIRATERADTSMAGFPGTVESLAGQDDGISTGEVPSGDDATLALLEEAYQRLGRYAARAQGSEGNLVQAAQKDDKEAQAQGRREAEALAIDVSNLIAELQQTDVASGAQADDLDHLLTLGNWLRNYVDALCDAWDDVARSDVSAADWQSIEALLGTGAGGGGKNAYWQLFDDNYEAWRPVADDGSS